MDSHIKHLPVLLSKFAGLLYRIREVISKDIIFLLFHSLMLRRVHYGILVREKLQTLPKRTFMSYLLN